MAGRLPPEVDRNAPASHLRWGGPLWPGVAAPGRRVPPGRPAVGLALTPRGVESGQDNRRTGDRGYAVYLTGRPGTGASPLLRLSAGGQPRDGAFEGRALADVQGGFEDGQVADDQRLHNWGVVSGVSGLVVLGRDLFVTAGNRLES